MVDKLDLKTKRRDRALLRAVLQGQGLQQIAGARGDCDWEVRADLHRVLVALLDRPGPAVADPGRAASPP